MRRHFLACAVGLALVLPSCAAAPGPEVPAWERFHDPRPVTLLGHDGEAMVPFAARDGRYLLFNNRKEPAPPPTSMGRNGSTI